MTMLKHPGKQVKFIAIVLLVLSVLIVDIVYMFVDPRIKL